jgi:epoxyqueuosine reductase
LERPRLVELVRLDDSAFRTLFAKNPVKRIGRERFIRNVLIAIGNSGDQTLAREAEDLLCDGSALVRAMAVWALARLKPERLAAHTGLRDEEQDSDVLEEWRAAGIPLQEDVAISSL